MIDADQNGRLVYHQALRESETRSAKLRADLAERRACHLAGELPQRVDCVAEATAAVNHSQANGVTSG
jgi:hypothetical protein